jgi:putative ABC transport system permease protein
MNWLRKVTSQFYRLIYRRRVEADIREEMMLHLEHRAQEKVLQGMAPPDAMAESRREFGNLMIIQEDSRAAFGWQRLDQFHHDAVFASRLLKRNPSFSVTVILSIALCVGINAAVFSVLYALILRPLPYESSDRIVEIYNSFPKVGIPKLASNIGQYLDFKENISALQTVALWREEHDALGRENGTARIITATATEELFPLLHISPLRGHFFSVENHFVGADKVVLLTESFWREKFSSDEKIVGAKIRLNNESFEVIGILPHVFESFDARVRAVRPFSWPSNQPVSRSGFSPTLIARLAPSGSMEQARAQLRARENIYYKSAPISANQFRDKTGQTIEIDGLENQRTQPLRLALTLMQAGAAAILLIGIINVVNLQLARLNSRTGEFLLRSALGASRSAILRQLFAEASLLVVLGTMGGIAIAFGALGAANHFATILLPTAPPFGIGVPDWRLIAFSAFAITLTIAIAPYFAVRRITRKGSSLHSTERGASVSPRRRWLGGFLVSIQVGFALVLSITAGLLLHSFLKVISTPPGFDTKNLFSVRFDLPAAKEKELPERLHAALNGVPEFRASIATATPFFLVPPDLTSMPLGAVLLKDIRVPASQGLPSAYYCGADVEYAEVLRIPIIRGRWFTSLDMKAGRGVVIDENFSRRYLGNEDPIGKRVVLNRGAPEKLEDWMEIIGVAGNVPHNGPEDRSGFPFIYLPRNSTNFFGSGSILIRTSRTATDVFSAVRSIGAAIDPTIPLYAFDDMDGVIATSEDARRGVMILLGSFAAIALLLSNIGVYGVLSYNVSRRTREIGIRSALGATRQELLRMVIGDGLKNAVIGIVLGLCITFLGHRWISALLFEIRSTDLIAYSVCIVLLILSSLIASWLPARRAANVDANIALRAD